LGRLQQLMQPDGAIHRYAYDAAGNLTEYTDPLGARTAYQYNGLEQPIARIDALGHSLRYAYDAIGRLTALQNENQARYRFAYDAADNLIEETGFDRRIQRYRYNQAGELTELHERQDEQTPYGELPTDELPKRTLFERDALGRLIGKQHMLAVQKSGQAALIEQEPPSRYSYDPLGRILEAYKTARTGRPTRRPSRPDLASQSNYPPALPADSYSISISR